MSATLPAFIGIDPGLNGAIAVLSRDGTLLALHDTPSIKHKMSVRRERRFRDPATKKLVRTGEKVTKEKIAREPDAYAMADLLRPYLASSPIVALEQVGPRPREAPSAAFKFGSGYGVWLGILGAFQMKRVDYRPQKWQEVIFGKRDKGEGKRDAKEAKQQSVARARALFPAWADRIGKHDGRSDAILIAESLRRLSLPQHNV